MSQRPDDATVTAWALAAGRGDTEALAAFVRATQTDVHRFLVHLSGPADAEDLAQETYLRALRTLPSFAARASARTWLLSIARRVSVDAVRTAVRRPRTQGADDWEGLLDRAGAARPGAGRSGAHEAVLLRALVADLGPERREAFVLTQMLDLSYAEAAQVCDCPVGTIRSRVARAREDLVDALDADRGSGASPGRCRDGA
ncbi:MAG: sigma-70 family RNA polymerase sigma factor [Pseudonocardia sp.]|nr:sigma-70 family RNA polymerase sigma factor [Pseudonocardia sp.]